ncbi:hypothetical protein LIER_37885 [Lithospermum erythrorhizon]|uniref:Retroviral polymerase SH3-like domain-containing protein n=1 Tax=Lithospermum erythrorhizon TaxID=34254 RepID=A0AAV3PUP6_LITER
MFQSFLPKRFWGDAILITTHIINRLPWYPSGQKGYKVFDLASKKVVVSRDGKFHESSFPYSPSFSKNDLVPIDHEPSVSLPNCLPCVPVNSDNEIAESEPVCS